MAVGQNQCLVYVIGDWDVHWGYGLLTPGHMFRNPYEPVTLPDSCFCNIASRTQATCAVTSFSKVIVSLSVTLVTADWPHNRWPQVQCEQIAWPGRMRPLRESEGFCAGEPCWLSTLFADS